MKTADTKPPRAGYGRPKGSRNKLSAELRDLILGALNEAGGQAYLVERAKDPRTAGAFLALLGKVLPMTVTGTGPDGSIRFDQIIRTIVDPARTGLNQ